MKRISICVTALLFIFVSGFNSSAQLSDAFLLDNVSASGVQQMFFRSKVIKVGNYNYVCGATINGNGNYDILLSKFDARVDTLVWSTSYNGVYNGNDYAADFAVDGSSNVIVVGTTQVGSLDYNAIAIKYNSSGVRLWSSTYAGAASGPDGFTTVVLNGTDVYAAGGALVNVSNMTDVLCVKYNSSGMQQWATTWNNSSTNLQDAAANISISGSNIAIVAATQETLGAPKWKVATIRMNASTGSVVDSAISSGGSAVAFTEIKNIALDASESIYVCGTRTVTGQGKNIYVVKYNASLTQAWTYTKNGSANADDEGIGLELNGSSVFISGYTTTTGEGRNLYAAKLAQSNGAVTWEVSHHLADGDDEATGLQIDSGVNLIIPCNVDRNSTKDIAIVKLNSNTGSNLATNFYNSEYNRDEFARDIAINSTNNDVYVSTQVQVNDTTYESRIIKWRQTKVYSPEPVDGYSSYSGYIPNNMQLRATDSTANRTVRFYNQSNAIATYIDDSKISYQLVLANDTANADTTYRVDMALVGGKPNAKVYPYGERKEYINYYLGHMDKPSIRTPLSNVVLKQDVYTHTDVLFTSSPTGFRHWFIARTGATPSNYQMSFTGQTGLSVDGSGNLVITTTIGNITYKKAKAYSMNTTTGVLTLLGWQPTYTITGSSVKFGSIGAWSGVLVLEVDEYKPVASSSVVYVQNLEWSTFFGGSGGEMNWDVKNDEGGNVWYCGQTSDWIFPENSGTNIGQYNLQEDAYVVKFDSLCRADWFTFYGGFSEDIAYALAIDDDDNSYCVGYTRSSNIPMLDNPGMDFNTLRGYSDGFFLKLNEYGVILIDSYIGGNGADIAYDIDYRPAGGGMDAAIFIAGYGDSGVNFPLQASPFASSYNQNHSGGYDGFLMRLNGSTFELEWSTFFGGSGQDFIYGIANIAGKPAIVGHTKTNYYTANTCAVPSDGGFPSCVAPGGWQQPSYQSTVDYNFFIARFDEKDALKYSTYHGKADLLGNAMRRPQIESYYKYYDSNSEAKYFFYVSGCTSGEAATDFPFNDWPLFYPNNAYYYTHDSISYGSLLWLAMLYVNDDFTTVEGCTALEWKDYSMNASMAVDKDKGITITGSSIIQDLQSPADCTLPTDGEFPLCDQSGTQYMEDNLNASGTRSYIMHFDSLMRLDWSTQYGDRPTNFNTCVSTAGEYIFVGGYSFDHYTRLEFNEISPLDYYRDFISGADQDAVIARFKLPQYVGVNEHQTVKELEKLLLYPNPTTGALNIVLPFAASNNDRMDIFDIHGKLISSQNIPVRSKHLAIDARLLASGMYIVRYNTKDKVLTHSFIKE
jgi:hypothetical protein